ncbi:ArsR/SmtB family transcription factor [Kribbella sp. NPDC056951]|uniref:ArsR/SmtB family transcription factor n=1 Tax=Kribbella sp. NPDC056951 TaxID=3345978 RepID=UPI00363E3087
MVLRIYFTSEDLRRVRIAGGPHPLWELVLSINCLQQDDLPPQYWSWRDSVGTRGRARALDARVLQSACAVVPAAGNFADFLTPTVDELDAQAHFESMLALPAAAVRADLTRTYRRLDQPPRWAHRLHELGRPDGVVRLLRDYRAIALQGPVWGEVHRHVETARARYAHDLLSGGLDVLLAGLHPSIRWKAPVLEADYSYDLDLELGGRGLQIVPAYFNFGGPLTFIDGDQPPTLVCPAVRDWDGIGTITPTIDTIAGLGDLIGHTRAKLLAAVGIAASTNQLAHRLHVTPAAISQHTKTLREAGLVTTTRTGQSVRHAVTPLGRSLLRSDR